MMRWLLFFSSFIPPLLTQRIEASDFFSLDSSAWMLTSSSGDVIQAVVPGDVVSALSASGRIASPWLDLTWREQAGLWDLQSWTYTLQFTSPFSTPPGGDVLLVLEGVKLAADVFFNNASLGFTANQHLRYVFSVGALLVAPGAPNVLTVSFPPTVADVRNDNGRFMGASGGWGALRFPKGRRSDAAVDTSLPSPPPPLHTHRAQIGRRIQTKQLGARRWASAPLAKASPGPRTWLRRRRPPRSRT